MESDQEITSRPLQRLDYFVEWGGKGWQYLMTYAFKHFIGRDLRGQHVLEIGTRYGKMACLFALLGAKVVGFDISKRALEMAQEEATKLKIEGKTLFVQGGGDLASVSANAFDMVFSKSVLVLVPDMVRFLEEVKEKLKPGGKIVFLENAKGPWWVHLLRTFRNGKWSYKWSYNEKWSYTRARYFTTQEIRMVSEVFDELVVRSWAFPPIVLMMGRKPNLNNSDMNRDKRAQHSQSATSRSTCLVSPQTRVQHKTPLRCTSPTKEASA